MTRIYIDNPVRSDFTMVPNALIESGLTLEAQGLFLRLLTYRHGAMPTAVQIEEACGIGKDKRQRIMRELERAGLAAWCVVRTSSGRVSAKVLKVSTRPLLGLSDREPENPAYGHREPEKPADGFSGSEVRKNRSAEPENAAIKEEYIDEKEPPAVFGDLEGLAAACSPFARSSLLAGRSAMIGGTLVKADSSQGQRLVQLLRNSERPC